MPARSQRRWQDDNALCPHRLVHGHVWRLLRLRLLHQEGRRRRVHDARHLPPARRALAHPHRQRAPPRVRLSQGRAARRARRRRRFDARLYRPRRQAARARVRALRRDEAQAVGGLRADRRFEGGAARRAHFGDGPRVEALAVGLAQGEHAGARPRAHDALHGRGGPPRRPHRRHVDGAAALRRLLRLPQEPLRARVHANDAQGRRVLLARRGRRQGRGARSWGRGAIASRCGALLPLALRCGGAVPAAAALPRRAPSVAPHRRLRHVGHFDGGSLPPARAGRHHLRQIRRRRRRRHLLPLQSARHRDAGVPCTGPQQDQARRAPLQDRRAQLRGQRGAAGR
mmetsp:Transcript_20489/g.47258  ORF Transcript_20489/g.47258 Transcript_20489/m.47258 type:complete len:342 (+) Transcript_20489:1809-2834(+)